jgi:type I restriction enzyme S subunit
MNSLYPIVPLIEACTPVERPEVPTPGQSYRQIGVQLWGRGAYERGTIDGAQTKYATLSRVKADDIIVNKIWARNGSVAVVTDSLAGCYGSGEFPTFAPIREKLEPRWFHWITKTRWFWEQCDEKSRGTSGQNRIRPERFLEVAIPLPPLAEQRRIVARIEELAAKIAEARGLRREAVEEANAWVSSLHLSLAQGRTLQLNQIVVLDECREPVEPERQYPQVGVKGFGQGLFPKEAVNASETTYKAFNRLYDGALVLSQVKGWEGAIAVCDKELAGWYVSPEYRTFSCIPNQAVP